MLRKGENMETVKKTFVKCEKTTDCEQMADEQTTDCEQLHIKRGFLSLRRNGINTMDDLFCKDADTLLKMREIGSNSVALIMEACRKYKQRE